MAAKLIRDDLLESERVQTLPLEARWMYMGLLLKADDLGLFDVAEWAIARRSNIDVSVVPGLIAMMVERDLVRTYQVAGKTYGFIPRYGQRVRIKRIKHPAPPDALLADEPETLKALQQVLAASKINNLGPKVLTYVSTVLPEPEPEPEPKKEKEQEQAAALAPEVVTPTACGSACKAMRQGGLQAVNPMDPRIAALVAQGVTPAEFEDAARAAVKGGKGFAWALARIVGQRRDAAALTVPKVPAGPEPGKVQAAATDEYLRAEAEHRKQVEADRLRRKAAQP
jgi:hypothetical protein